MIKSNRIMHNEKAFTLIAIIIIVLLAGILASSSVFFIGESLRHNTTRSYQEKTINLAQAGIYRAIYNFRISGSYSEINTNVEGNQWFIVGSNAANYLLIDTQNTRLLVSNTRLQDFEFTNINTSQNITLDKIRVSWEPYSGGEGLNQVRLNNAVVWSGSAISGDDIDISNRTINIGNTLKNNRIHFNQNMSSKTIYLTLFLSDGSFTGPAQAYPPNNASFFIKSTGKIVEGSGVKMRRTIQAAYDVNEGKITSWKEINEHNMD
ncbi:MAG: hypothetical protein ABIA63_15195 [bacterium]